jgi:hypothetical protein
VNKSKGVPIMPSEIISMLLSGTFSLAGAGLGVIATSKLTSYRLGELEKKVDTLTRKVEEFSSLGQRIALIEQRMNLYEKEHK